MRSIGAPTDGILDSGVSRHVFRALPLRCTGHGPPSQTVDWDTRHAPTQSHRRPADGHVEQTGAPPSPIWVHCTLVCACSPRPTTLTVRMPVRAARESRHGVKARRRSQRAQYQ